MQLWDEKHPGIYIDDSKSPSFLHATVRELNKIRSRPVGKDLLAIISKRCLGIGTKAVNPRVVIKLGSGTLTDSSMEKTLAAPDAMDTIQRKERIPGSNVELPGVGTASEVTYNPWVEHQYSNAAGVATPAFVALAHELCHSLHFLNGDVYRNDDFDVVRMHEEARTVGAGKYANMRISENAIRKEHGIRLRTHYSAPGDCNL